MGKRQNHFISDRVGFLHPTTNHSAYLLGLAVEFHVPSTHTRTLIL